MKKTMCKTCKTCKHWADPGRKDTWNAELICKPKDPDTYESMIFPFEVRLCKHPAQTFAERPVESNGFGLVDGSEYYACLATAEDFGCVRYEAPVCCCCGSTEDITFGPDPYNSDINNDHTRVWECGACRQISADDI